MKSLVATRATETAEDAAAPERIGPRPRGFAALTADERRRLGSKGGQAAHARGTANRFTPEAASLAGRIPHENGTAYRWTSEQAREAGRRGGTTARRKKSVGSDAEKTPTD